MNTLTTQGEIKSGIQATLLDWLGARVTREVFMDDGTWAKEGDKCLRRSPLKHGEVIAIGQLRGMLTVRWDNGTIRHYFPHGIDRDLSPTRNKHQRYREVKKNEVC